VHGDIKPRSFVRYENDFALINLHACTKIGSPARWSIASPAYLPPEAVCKSSLTVRQVPEIYSNETVTCRCGESAVIPRVVDVSLSKSKVTLTFDAKHPFARGRRVCLSGFLPETTTSGVAINTVLHSFVVFSCTDLAIELIISDELSDTGHYKADRMGVVSFSCVGLCGRSHVAHDMWALGVLIFRREMYTRS
jgi:hypothetical protein